MEPQPHIVMGLGLPQGAEWIWIALICLLLFGRRLPEVMRGLGGSVKEFKKGMEEGPKIETPVVPPPKVEGAVSRDQHPSVPPAASAPPAPTDQTKAS